MFRNYLKISFRNILKHKGLSFINTVGLSLGMACVILIMLWVRYETSFDTFHKNKNYIYRVAGEDLSNPSKTKMVVTPPPLAPALLQDISDIEKACRLSRGGGAKLFSYQDKHFFESFYAVDQSFFDIFTYEFIKGDTSNPLRDPYSIVISEKMAGKLFGSQDPVGKTIIFNQKTDFQVTGVFKNVPSNSHLTRDIMIPFETCLKLNEEPLDHWMYWSFYTYILVKPGSDINRIEAKFPDFTKKYGIPNVRLFLQPLNTIRLHSHFVGELSTNTRVSTLVLFGTIAFLILIIGCINYMNFTTARTSVRLKEIGARKVIGARRLQIAGQFLGESLVISFVSLGFSLLLVDLFLPIFNALAEQSLSLSGETLFQIIPGIVILALCVGLLGGSYPAFLLSSFNPITILRDGSGKNSQKSKLRNSLVIIQFSISIVLITSTLLVKSQLDYIRNMEMGFNKEQIVVIPILEPGVSQNVGPLIKELKRNPRIRYATVSMHLPNEVGASTTASWPGKPKDLKITIKASEAGYEFVDLYGIKIVQGRNFSREFPSDENGAFLVNEKAVKVLGDHFRLGMEFQHWHGKGKIVGVMKDYHLNSLHEEIKPLYIFLNPNQGHQLSVKIQKGNIPETIEFIRETLKKFSPHYPIEYQFFDDLFNMTYRKEQKMEEMFAIFAMIAIFIACMGIFGLSLFVADQKRKEIGIRKVLGAPVSKIVYLLTSDLVRLVLLAIIIGWPIAFFIMNRWLQNFAYRTDIHTGIFLLSAFLTLLVSIGSLSVQTIKAAKANPVESLRYE